MTTFDKIDYQESYPIVSCRHHPYLSLSAAEVEDLKAMFKLGFKFDLYIESDEEEDRLLFAVNAEQARDAGWRGKDAGYACSYWLRGYFASLLLNVEWTDHD